MITVIIAGGSGTRLWPLSTSDYPKHLLQLIGERTLLQTTYDRAAKLGETVYVITEAGHAHHVKEQLTELSDDAFIIEPGRRGTANCIIMALDIISRRHDREEPVAFIHADHQVRDIDGFQRSFKIAAETATERREICLIGIEPTFAATGFGYIERDDTLDEDAGVYNVLSFKEKPDFETATKYLESGRYLWNCGYFVGSVAIFIDEMAKSATDLKTTYDHLNGIQDTKGDEYSDAYLALSNEVIDTALIEKASSLAVVAASFDWMDIGSFKDLHEANVSDERGNHLRGDMIFGDEIENAYVRNDEDKPVVVIGLDNIVVVNTPNGILVARKDLSQKVKDAVAKIQDAKQ